MEAIYKRVKSGEETRRVLSSTGRADYREQLGKELKAIADSEMWRAGQATRSLRPREAAKTITKGTKGIGGRKGN
jgi:ketol-acid reductoisomerase